VSELRTSRDKSKEVKQIVKEKGGRLRRKVLAGNLGHRTGKGWYDYNPDGGWKKNNGREKVWK